MADLKKIAEVLSTKGKVRGKPVAITLFREGIPKEYEPIETEPCTIIRYAMDEGKKVYFDAAHHDCLVGAMHSGMIPPKKEIVSGEYLSTTSNFFSYEGAARLKAGTRNLPLGMVKAIGAAPLDDVSEGVPVDWVVVVCNPHNANLIAACRVIQDGVTPCGGFGTSLCGELFATPWYENNVVVTFGDFGGRMFNRIKQDQLFVVIPLEYVDNLPKLLVDVQMDTKANLGFTKPERSKFWQKHAKDIQIDAASDAEEDPPAPIFSMDWDKEARSLIMKAPEGVLEFAITNVEDFAREQGCDKITKQVIIEQMQSMGMDPEDMLAE